MFERATALGLLLVALGAAAQEPPPNVKLSGYYKNLLIRSETVFPAGEDYTLDLNRLRLELEGRLAPALAFDVQYDNELSLGNYLRTAEFALRKGLPSQQYWKLASNYAEGGNYDARHGLYRAYTTLSFGATDVRFGRQRIAWGTGRFWSPLDLFNPINPVALERDERLGVDALLVEQQLGPLARVSAVYAPWHDSAEASLAALWHGNVAGADYSVVGGRFRGDRVVGADMAGQVGAAGIRAELTYTRPRTGAEYARALLAADYAFANTLTLSAELYFNGAGASDAADYDFASLFAGRIQNVARRYLGLYAGYEITPLLKWTNYAVANLDDGSRFYSPGLTYSLRTNVDWTLGVQLFGGDASSEYGRFKDVYYTYLQWYF